MSKQAEGWLDRMPRPIVYTVIALIVAGLVWMATGLGGPSKTTREGIATTDFLTDMARKSQGKLSNLTPEEQKKVQDTTGGQGETVLQNLYGQMPQDPDVELPPRTN